MKRQWTNHEMRNAKLADQTPLPSAISDFRFSIFALLFVLAAAIPAAATTVSGTIKKPDGTAVTGTIEFVLSQQAKTTTPPILFAPVRTTCAVTSGQIAAGCTVQGNNTLDPAGTYYTVRVVDTNNRAVVPAANYTIAGSSVDLGTLPVTASATLVPPSGAVAGNLSVTGNLTVAGSADITSQELDVSHLRLLGLTADPATAIDGSIFRRSDLNRIRFRARGLQLFDGTQYVDITSSLPNTVDIGGDLRVAGTTQLGLSADLTCVTNDPTAPNAGDMRFYCLQGDKRIYQKNDAGLVAGPLAALNQPQSWSAAQSFTRVNAMRFADQFPGADAGAKIKACINDLPASGGVCDARGLEGAQTFTTDPFAGVNKPIVLITGAATYSWDTEALAVILPSDFTWILNNTTLQTSAVGKGGFSSSNQGLLNLRQTSTTGSITTGTNTLTVASATNFDVGDLVGVIGAEGGTSNQRTTLSGAHSSGGTTLVVTSVAGWGNATNYLLLNGSELALCNGISGSTFTSCTRGIFGTTAVSYVGGETVDAVSYFVSPITAVSGTTITLENTATKTVTNADVTVGSTNVSIVGRGVLDGRVDRAVGASLGLVGIESKLGSRMYVGPEVVIRGFEASGVQLNSAWRNTIEAAFEGNGRPAASLGFDVMVFGKSGYNEIKTAWHRDGNQAVTLDDRTTVYSIFSGAPFSNKVDIGPVVINYASGLNLQGAGRTEARTSYVDASEAVIIGGGQWTSTVIARDNIVYAGPLNATTAIDLTTNALGGNNMVIAPRIMAGAVVNQPGNILQYHKSADTLTLNDNLALVNGRDAAVSLSLDSGGGVVQNSLVQFKNNGALLWDAGKLANNDFIVSQTGVATQLELRAGATSFLRSGSATANVILGSSAADRVIVEGSTGNLLPSAGAQNLGSSGAPWGGLFAQTATLSSGMAPDAGGFKHKRTSTGSIAAGASAAVTLTWTTPFADANYTIVGCEVEDATAATLALRKHHIESKTAAAVAVRIVNDDGAAAHSGTLHCTAVHD